MRTFRKALCLVMAMLFVLGLCTIGASAAVYTDDADIQYKNAVTITNGLGITEGFPDKSFKPQDNVTRAQAAKMIAVMMLGKDNAEKVPGGTGGFSDVPATHWAAKYISFCSSKGIIKGMGDGTFAPNASVTGVQLATMLLRACGYGVMGEYEGKGWDVNAVTDALTEGIFEDALTEDFSKPATREECALFVFNTLNDVNIVGYDVDLNYYDELADAFGRAYTYGSKVFKLDNNNDTAVQITENQATGAAYTVAGGVNYKLETGKDMIAHNAIIYYRDVQKKDADGNQYYDAYVADDVSTVVKGGTRAAVYKELVNANKNNEKADYNQVPVWTNYVEGAAKGGTAATIEGWKGVNNKRAYFGGTMILDENGEYLAIMTTKYTVDKVKAIDKEDGLITLENDGASSITPAVGGKPVEYKLENAYEGIKKGDIVTVIPVGKIYTIEPTSTVTVDITEVSIGKANATGDDALTSYNDGKYRQGGYYDGASKTSDLVKPHDEFNEVKPGFTVTLSLDSRGSVFAVHIEDEGDFAGKAFLVKTWSVKTDKKTVTNDDGYEVTIPASTTYKATCVNEAGDKIVYDLQADGSALAQGVYNVILDNKGKAKLVAADDDLGEMKKSGNKTSFLNGVSGGTYYVTSDTTIYLVKENKAKGTLTVTESSKLVSDGTNYATYTSSKDLKTVWVFGGTAAPVEDVSGSYMFVADGERDGFRLVGTDRIPYFYVYIDGVEEEILVDGGDKAEIDTGFFTYKKDSKGYYTLTDASAKGATKTLVEGDIHDGKFYLTADGVNISSLKVVATDTWEDKDGKNDLVIESVADIEGLLDDGYSVTVSYITKKSGSNVIPTGVIYVTDVK